jgi:hypothetical protein
LDGALAAYHDSWAESGSQFYGAEGPVGKLYFPVFDVLDCQTPPCRGLDIGAVLGIPFVGYSSS